MTVQTLLVLQALLQHSDGELYGLEVVEETGLLVGTAYPILQRLENEGWVTSRWEEADPRAEKRPIRRYYRLTDVGAVRASAAVAGARRPSRTALRRLAGEADGWAQEDDQRHLGAGAAADDAQSDTPT
jgi:PadR family transcriptional regulator, regulatory protein PadR